MVGNAVRLPNPLPAVLRRVDVVNREPASINAAFKCWWVNSGEFEQDPDAAHWGVFWEPLDVDLPETAKPSCCYNDCIVFYDKTGNKLLKDFEMDGSESSTKTAYRSLLCIAQAMRFTLSMKGTGDYGTLMGFTYYHQNVGKIRKTAQRLVSGV